MKIYKGNINLVGRPSIFEDTLKRIYSPENVKMLLKVGRPIKNRFMSLNQRIKAALAKEDMVKVYGPHSKYSTYRAKYYQTLKLLYEVDEVLDENHPSYVVEDIVEAFDKGRGETNRNEYLESKGIFLVIPGE